MDIIAQRWKTPGNIGALARAMKNFEFEQMVLLNPDCDHLCKEAMDRSTQAKQILHNAQVVERLEYDILIGTTSALGSSYNVIRNPITAEQLAQMELKGKEVLYIDDSEDHIKVAKEFGMKTVLFEDNTKLFKELKKLKIK